MFVLWCYLCGLLRALLKLENILENPDICSSLMNKVRRILVGGSQGWASGLLSSENKILPRQGQLYLSYLVHQHFIKDFVLIFCITCKEVQNIAVSDFRA